MAMRYVLPLLLLAVPARAELKTDIEFAVVGGTSLTLDAFVPDGDGPFPTCILVHGGGFTQGDKTSFIKPLFEPLSQAGFTWFTIMQAAGNACELIAIDGGGHGMGGWERIDPSYKDKLVAWLRTTLGDRQKTASSD